MGIIKSGLFISLDGVVESPDQWQFPYFNDEMGAAVGAPMPPMNDRRETPVRSILSVITVLPGGTQTKHSDAAGPEGREAKPKVYSRLTANSR